MRPGWRLVTRRNEKNLRDGRMVLLKSVNGHILLGFRRRGNWLTNYGTPVQEEIEQFYVYPAPKENK